MQTSEPPRLFSRVIAHSPLPSVLSLSSADFAYKEANGVVYASAALEMAEIKREK